MMRAAEAEKKQSVPAAIAVEANLSLAAAHFAANIFQFFVLPLYFLPASRWWALLLLPLAALNNPFWSLMHESIHDLFHPSRRVNRAMGRALSIFFGAPFLVLRLSHLLHHKLNRSLIEATEVYAPEKTSRGRAAFGYFANILGGLYLLELASPLMFFLPRAVLRRMEKKYFMGADLPGNLMRSLMRDSAVREMRLDGILVLVLFGASVVCYGTNWPFLAAALAARAFLISFLDNVYHYDTPIGDTFYARNLSLPPAFSAGLLHFNLHGVHHRNPSIPWAGLPEAFEREASRMHGGYFTAALAQLHGPIPLAKLSR
ncbi:MAG TPA: fatty acid desaturase [Verrucomicrobiae bacterium]|jgi:fatty acid desaturase|nr:fatty acid desaturase [Verrucomicrobiae bacterium]